MQLGTLSRALCFSGCFSKTVTLAGTVRSEEYQLSAYCQRTSCRAVFICHLHITSEVFPDKTQSAYRSQSVNNGNSALVMLWTQILFKYRGESTKIKNFPGLFRACNWKCVGHTYFLSILLKFPFPLVHSLWKLIWYRKVVLGKTEICLREASQCNQSLKPDFAVPATYL